MMYAFIMSSIFFLGGGGGGARAVRALQQLLQANICITRE